MKVNFNMPLNTHFNAPFFGQINFASNSFVQNQHKQKSLNFLGLTKTAKSRVFIEPKLLQKINGVKNTDIVGEPPREFILALKKAGFNKEDTGKEIKKLMNSFTLAAAELRAAEENYTEKQDFQFLEFARILEDKLETGNPFEAQKLFQRLLRIQGSYATFAPVSDKAASHIDKAFKEAGVLPRDGKTSLDFVSEGGRGYAFKVSFLDKNGEKVFHDKILKLYRSPMSVVTKQMAKTVDRYINDEPDEYFRLCREKMTEYYDANAYYIQNYYNLPKKVLVACKVDDYMLLVEDFQRRNKGKSFEDFYKYYNDFANEFVAGDINHGVCAEANTATYIKNKVGNIQEYDYIEPWFFNLKTGYSLFEMSDDALLKPEKELDLSKYGLYHSDLEFNRGNIVKGRVIDYGGIRLAGI